MPRLVGSSFDEFETGISQRMVFVGITRAINWAYLSGIAGQEMPALKRLCGLEKMGSLVVQCGQGGTKPDSGRSDRDDSVDIDVVDVL